MKVFQGIQKVSHLKNPVVTIGTFDGVHLGHQKILNRLKTVANELQGESVLFTFYPHPRMVLFPENTDLKLLQTQNEKIEKLKNLGLNNLIVEPFTLKFSRLSAEEFVRDYLVNSIGVKKLIIGYDHQFGRNKEGNIDKLKDLSQLYGFEVEEIPAKDIDQINISSTKIRNAILNGEMETVKKFMGEPFAFSGQVVSGDKIGRTLGYPTANINVNDKYKIKPSNGVYAVRVCLNGIFFDGMMNVGVRPTHSDLSKEFRIEVYIFSFDKNIYNQEINIQVLKRIRDEIHFDNVNDLISQLKNDEKICLDFFSNSVY